jgi:hypothetical protein
MHAESKYRKLLGLVIDYFAINKKGFLTIIVGRDSSIGIGTCYGFDSSGPGRGKIFRNSPDRP